METIFLVLTAAIVIGGEIATRGEVVEVTKAEARDLLNRGKARLATEADGIPMGQDGTTNAPGTPAGDEQPAADTSAPETPPAPPAAPASADEKK